MLKRIESSDTMSTRLCIGAKSLSAAKMLPRAIVTVFVGLQDDCSSFVPSTEDDGTNMFLIPGDLRVTSLVCAQLGFLFNEILCLEPSLAPSLKLAAELLADKGTLILGKLDTGARHRWVSGFGFEELSNDHLFVYRHHSSYIPVSWLKPTESDESLVADAMLNKNSKPKLGIAAIVRNEARAVANMIRTCIPVASFFAILDTGSTDATAQIVRETLAGCDVPHRIATGTFSRFDEARNESIRMVPPDIDWILMLDGDEELDPQEYSSLQKLLLRTDIQVFSIPRYNYWDRERSKEPSPYPDRQRRFFRNDPEKVHFTGAVHETIKIANSEGVADIPLNSALIGGDIGGPHIHHFVRVVRTLDEEREKQGRYKEIAKLQDEPRVEPN